MTMITIPRLLLLAVLCGLCACSTTAPKTHPGNAVQGTDQQTLTTTDKKELDKVVCREEAPIGSRIGSRVCMTRRHWIELQNRGRKSLEDMKRSSVVSPLPNPAGGGN